MGLYMLYGADYFTNEEWFKIDLLLHKGKYVLTQGPPQARSCEEELIDFGEKMEPKIHVNTTKSVEPFGKDLSEQQIPSPTSSEGPDSQDETPNVTSVEPSSDEETAPTSISGAAPMINSFDNKPESTPLTQRPQPQTTSGLPPGITQ